MKLAFVVADDECVDLVDLSEGRLHHLMDQGFEDLAIDVLGRFVGARVSIYAD
jgi:hypothetical protein